MKLVYIIIILAVLFVLIVGAFKISNAKTETQAYETIYKNGKFEIRFYPEAILATVKMNGNYDSMRNSGFRILAGYIFGGNEENQKIAMTSPVRMSTKDSQNTMSFVLPSKMDIDNLPTPVSKQIILHQSKPVYVAALRYGGYTNNREIEEKEAELTNMLIEMGIENTGNYEYLGYNAPFDMINRRNEVVVELPDFDPDTFMNRIKDSKL